MRELFLYRGLPGSGKTTRARELQKNTGGRLVGRDHIRFLLFGKYEGLTRAEENEVTKTQEYLIREGLRADQKVIVDDMNLRTRYIRRFQEIAHSEDAVVSIIDLTNVDIDTCLAQNVTRDKFVQDALIRDLHARFIQGSGYPLPLPEDRESGTEGQQYTYPEGKPNAVIVDIDGTVAKMNGRSPYDYTKVSEDIPNAPVVKMVQGLTADGYKILFTSGRPDSCRDETGKWLVENVGVPFRLFMRGSNDKRNDAIVKRELFDRHIRYNYRVEFVLDDRNRVVEMWRSLGLTCLQVAEGNF